MSACYNENNQDAMMEALFDELDFELQINSKKQLATLNNEHGVEVTSGCLEDVWDRCALILKENHLEIDLED